MKGVEQLAFSHALINACEWPTVEVIVLCRLQLLLHLVSIVAAHAAQNGLIVLIMRHILLGARHHPC